ncbi:unnamed protein product [Cyprideis torosa]|uniref:Protein kinase domain-containing protein n=1 Tax=Cyprideis torosa TaxID=163714 RepID=A0A7R8ZNN3_9CRUS|nr:unnamed protein product [Cyprideis torosa]CAG0888133.1 unnamed protein product [Cyprideis torosa]
MKLGAAGRLPSTSLQRSLFPPGQGLGVSYPDSWTAAHPPSRPGRKTTRAATRVSLGRKGACSARGSDWKSSLWSGAIPHTPSTSPALPPLPQSPRATVAGRILPLITIVPVQQNTIQHHAALMDSHRLLQSRGHSRRCPVAGFPGFEGLGEQDWVATWGETPYADSLWTRGVSTWDQCGFQWKPRHPMCSCPHIFVKVERYILYIQLELMDMSLKDFIENRNREDYSSSLTLKDEDYKTAINIFQDLCAAVRFLHIRGYAHQDLKPGNILLLVTDENPRSVKTLKLADFGLATRWKGSLGISAGGTRSYAPRPVDNERATSADSEELKKKLDVYALGIIWVDLVMPMTVDKWSKVNDCLRSPNVTIPQEVQRLIGEKNFELLKKMLSHNPDQRPSVLDVCFLQTLRTRTPIVEPVLNITENITEQFAPSYSNVIRPIAATVLGSIRAISQQTTSSHQRLDAGSCSEIVSRLVQIFERPSGSTTSFKENFENIIPGSDTLMGRLSECLKRAGIDNLEENRQSKWEFLKKLGMCIKEDFPGLVSATVSELTPLLTDLNEVFDDFLAKQIEDERKRFRFIQKCVRHKPKKTPKESQQRHPTIRLKTSIEVSHEENAGSSGKFERMFGPLTAKIAERIEDFVVKHDSMMEEVPKESQHRHPTIRLKPSVEASHESSSFTFDHPTPQWCRETSIRLGLSPANENSNHKNSDDENSNHENSDHENVDHENSNLENSSPGSMIINRHTSPESIPRIIPASRFIRITGDGNCLFRALAYCLTGSEQEHAEVRQLLARTPQMRVDGEWGTVDEIQEAAAIFRANIAVWAPHGSTFEWQGPMMNERYNFFAQLRMLIFAALPAKSTAPISLKLVHLS